MKKVKKRVGVVLLILVVLGAYVLSLPMNSALAAGVPFNSQYAYGVTSIAENQAEANAMLKAEWEDWKSKRITSNGAGGHKRVQRDASTNYDTVSEGLGYGMLLSVCFDEQALFDDLYRYVKSHFNQNGLMHWHIDANNNVTTHDGGNGAATDADEDVALALIFADKQWGSGSINYSQEAKTLINNLYNHCVEQGSYVLKPGDMWGGSSVTNPSYFAPAWYKVFAKYTGDNRWNQVADKCYQIVEEVKKYNSGTGLVPDWCTASGTQASGQGYDYKYDATRYGWRTAVDYSWFGDSRSKANCDALTKFFSRDGAKGIADGYTIQGSKFSSNHNASFVGPVAAASMTGYDLNFSKELYKETVAVKDDEQYGYYGNCLRMLTLLYITGNFPNLSEDVVVPSPTPTATKISPTPTKTYEIIYGDLNNDGRVNSTDLTILKRYLLKITHDINEDAADVNKDGRINSTDMTILKRYLLKVITHLPY